MGKSKIVRPRPKPSETKRLDEAKARQGLQPKDLLAPPVYGKVMQLSRQIHLSTRKEPKGKKLQAAVPNPDEGTMGPDPIKTGARLPSIPADSRWHFINEMRNIPVWVATLILQANRREQYTVGRLALIFQAQGLMEQMTAQVRVSRDCGWLMDGGYNLVSMYVGDVNAQLRGWATETASHMEEKQVQEAEFLAGIWKSTFVPLLGMKRKLENNA